MDVRILDENDQEIEMGEDDDDIAETAKELGIDLPVEKSKAPAGDEEFSKDFIIEDADGEVELLEEDGEEDELELGDDEEEVDLSLDFLEDDAEPEFLLDVDDEI